jgi:hypothetical protein
MFKPILFGSIIAQGAMIAKQASARRWERTGSGARRKVDSGSKVASAQQRTPPRREERTGLRGFVVLQFELLPSRDSRP